MLTFSGMNTFVWLRERLGFDQGNPPHDCAGGRTCKDTAYYTVREREPYTKEHPLAESEHHYCAVHAVARVKQYMQERVR